MRILAAAAALALITAPSWAEAYDYGWCLVSSPTSDPDGTPIPLLGYPGSDVVVGYLKSGQRVRIFEFYPKTEDDPDPVKILFPNPNQSPNGNSGVGVGYLPPDFRQCRIYQR